MEYKDRIIYPYVEVDRKRKASLVNEPPAKRRKIQLEDHGLPSVDESMEWDANADIGERKMEVRDMVKLRRDEEPMEWEGTDESRVRMLTNRLSQLNL